MLTIRDIQFLLKVMDGATVKGLDANEAMVTIAARLTAMQKTLSVAAIGELHAKSGPKGLVKPIDLEKVEPNDPDPSKEVVSE